MSSVVPLSCSALFCLLLQAFQSLLHGMDRIAEIHAVVAEDDLSLMVFVSPHHDELCRRGTRVDADDHLFTPAVHGIERSKPENSRRNSPTKTSPSAWTTTHRKKSGRVAATRQRQRQLCIHNSVGGGMLRDVRYGREVRRYLPPQLPYRHGWHTRVPG